MEKIQQFFELVVEVWNKVFLGISFGRIILALLIIITVQFNYNYRMWKKSEA